jgi:hypothetical protein
LPKAIELFSRLLLQRRLIGPRGFEHRIEELDLVVIERAELVLELD